MEHFNTYLSMKFYIYHNNVLISTKKKITYYVFGIIIWHIFNTYLSFKFYIYHNNVLIGTKRKKIRKKINELLLWNNNIAHFYTYLSTKLYIYHNNVLIGNKRKE